MLCLSNTITPTHADDATPESLQATYDGEIRPLLKALCFECHGPDKAKADIRFDTLDPDLVHGPDAETWLDTLDQLNAGEMPPSKATQPTSEQRNHLTDWLTASLRTAAETKRFADGRVVTRRLTRYEYANTLRDLLGIELDFARELPPDPASPEGFLNNGNTLEMSGTQVETYLAAARKALAVAIVDPGEAPAIHRYEAAQTNIGKLPRSNAGGAKPVNPEFVLDIDPFPRTGEFLLRIRAGSVIPEGEDFPRMRVSLGNVPGIIHVPRKLVGEVDVIAAADQPATYEFRGRMEDFPQPGDRSFGGNVAFHGMLLMIDFLDADGAELRYADRTYSDPPAKKGNANQNKNAPSKGRPIPESGPRLDIVIDSVTFEAPHLVSWPPPSHTRWLVPTVGGEEKERARQALERFASRAFRRPVNEEEISRYLDLFEAVRKREPHFVAAIRETFAAVLVSPHFLYRVETRTDPVESETVTDHELASRLSYFLWSAPPDGRLTELADRGELLAPEILREEIERMLDDRRTLEFVNRFADQWFDLDALERVAVNPEFYPDFDDSLKEAMREETRGVLREILLGDLSCLELLDTNWTVANRALATHYELADRPRTSAFQRVSLSPEEKRGGVLAHGAFLLAQSDGQMPHPIKRAVWIRDRLLDSPPASPPAEVPELDPENPDLAGLSLKDQLAAHREKESCRDCHLGLDPWGIPLEHFDATGLWGTHSPVRIKTTRKDSPPDAGPPRGPLVDAATVLPDGTEVTGLDSLKDYLLAEQREAFARSLVKRLMGYSLGRSLDFGDREAVEALTADFVENDFRLRHLIVALATSESFRTK